MAFTCALVGKLGSGRISCSLFLNSIDDALIKLMTVTHTPVLVDKLHHLATVAGFEEDFLSHFGRKILPSKNIEDTEFWIGLVQRKLSIAFERESVTKGKHSLADKVILEDYWAAYDRTGDLERIGERNEPDSAPSLLIEGTINSSFIMDARQRATELRRREIHKPESPQAQGTSPSSDQSETSVDSGHTNLESNMI